MKKALSVLSGLAADAGRQKMLNVIMATIIKDFKFFIAYILKGYCAKVTCVTIKKKRISLYFKGDSLIFAGITLLSYYLVQTSDKLLCLLHAQAQGGQQTNDICAADACEHMLLEEQLCAYLLNRLLKLYTYHQALAAYLFYRGDFLKLCHILEKR